MSGWTLWILASAFFLALYDLAKKSSVRDNAVLPVLLVSTFFGGVSFTLSMAATGYLPSALSAVDGQLIALSAAKSVIVATSWVFTFRALKTLPITIATPIRASAPALVFLLAVLFYGERPSCLQGVGMVAVFGGYFAFSWAGRHEGIDFLRSRAVWYAVAGAVLSALSAVWDKFVFQVYGAPVESVQMLFQIGLFLVYALSLGVLTAFHRLGFIREAASPVQFHFRWTIPLVGIFLAAADWLFFTGIALPEVPISVASLLRRFSVVLTFLLGARLFHERNLRRKGIALGVILIGVVLICLT